MVDPGVDVLQRYMVPAGHSVVAFSDEELSVI